MRCRELLLVTWGLVSVAESAAQQTGLTLDWVSIDYGGGLSATGGGLTLDTTLGQVEAGVFASPDITMVGGFWAIAAAGEPPPPPPCDPCDVNCDNVIDLRDFDAYLSLLFRRATPCSECAGDTNGDGRVGLLDLPGLIECLFETL